MNDRADDRQGNGNRPVPRYGRAALLRLATWFEEAEPDRAEALATAAFALHPARQLEGRVDDGVAATTSWWQAEPDRSTVTEHPGARPPEPVRDHRAQQARLRDAAESSAHWRRAGAEQIRSLLARPTADEARLDLSGAGMEVLMELLTAALGSGDAARRPTSAGDLEFGLRLHVIAAPGAEVTVRGEGGDLSLEGLRLCVTPYGQHFVDVPAPKGRVGVPNPTEPVSDIPEPVEPAPTEPPSVETPRTGPPHAGTPHAGSPGEHTPHAPVGEPALTDNLPGPDSDTEDTGPIEITTQKPWTRRWG